VSSLFPFSFSPPRLHLALYFSVIPRVRIRRFLSFSLPCFLHILSTPSAYLFLLCPPTIEANNSSSSPHVLPRQIPPPFPPPISFPRQFPLECFLIRLCLSFFHFFFPGVALPSISFSYYLGFRFWVGDNTCPLFVAPKCYLTARPPYPFLRRTEFLDSSIF